MFHVDACLFGTCLVIVLSWVVGCVFRLPIMFFDSFVVVFLVVGIAESLRVFILTF